MSREMFQSVDVDQNLCNLYFKTFAVTFVHCRLVTHPFDVETHLNDSADCCRINRIIHRGFCGCGKFPQILNTVTHKRNPRRARVRSNMMSTESDNSVCPECSTNLVLKAKFCHECGVSVQTIEEYDSV